VYIESLSKPLFIYNSFVAYSEKQMHHGKSGWCKFTWTHADILPSVWFKAGLLA